MANTAIKELESTVSELHNQRKAHVDAIAEIDEAFGKLGIEAGAAPAVRRGRPPMSGKAGKAGRPKVTGKGSGKTGNRYPVSGTESILRFVKQSGAKGASGGAIDKYWKSEGRAGSAYNIMGQLVKSRKIKKQKNKKGRGSLYSAV